jgi:hypothetical protein
VNLVPDATELVRLIKRTAIAAVNATKPVNICFGTVISDSPLQIFSEQKLTLGEKQLILSRNVTDFEIDVTMEWESETALSTHTHGIKGSDSDGDSINFTSQPTDLSHSHSVKGRKGITVHNKLVVGDEVILIRQQEGQKYIVVDRLG